MVWLDRLVTSLFAPPTDLLTVQHQLMTRERQDLLPFFLCESLVPRDYIVSNTNLKAISLHPSLGSVKSFIALLECSLSSWFSTQS